MLPGRHGHRHPAARPAAGQRHTWPWHRLSTCHSFPAPLLPRRASALAFDAVLAGIGERPACRAMVGLLALAHERACEAELGVVLQSALDDGVLPDLNALIERFRPKGMALPVVIVTLPSLAVYDQIAATVGEAA